VIDFLHRAFVEPLGQVFFVKALLGGSIVALVSGVVGCLVVLRRMAFLGDALSHAMIAGVAGGYLFMRVAFGIEAYAPAMLVGSILAALLTVTLIGFVSRVSRVKDDAAIGIMYCGVFAGGVVLVSIFRNLIHIDLMHFIMGDVLGISDSDLWISVFVACLVLTLIILFFRHFQLSSFDPVMAASIGLPVVLLDYLFTTCVSMVVVSAVSMVGVILVVGLLITPAATAYLLSDRLDRMMLLSGIFGVSSVVGGLYLCMWIDSAGGGAIMLFCTFQFLVVLFVAPRYGILADWLRRRRMVPQELVEDILRSILKSNDSSVSIATLENYVHIGRGALVRAIRNLTIQGLLAAKDSSIALTDGGHREALRIHRAHRIWETYLAHVGAPAEEIHARAHHLEHYTDAESVDYLSHVLGHPSLDPHGQDIPQNIGNEFLLSQLREGQSGEVLRSECKEFQPGDRIELFHRDPDGPTWTVRMADGRDAIVSHQIADKIHVKIDSGAYGAIV
jgi:ABC-type Mn2+/Zn2+ transport system permease subunit/Mn-dependent DtxR family transcriptional regulator